MAVVLPGSLVILVTLGVAAGVAAGVAGVAAGLATVLRLECTQVYKDRAVTPHYFTTSSGMSTACQTFWAKVAVPWLVVSVPAAKRPHKLPPSHTTPPRPSPADSVDGSCRPFGLA